MICQNAKARWSWDTKIHLKSRNAIRENPAVAADDLGVVVSQSHVALRAGDRHLAVRMAGGCCDGGSW